MNSGRSDSEWQKNAPFGELNFSKVALEQIESLSEPEQSRLSQGIVRSYSKTTRFLVANAYATYIHINDIKFLNIFRTGKVTFDVEGYAVRVDIDKNNYNWTIQSIGLPGSLAIYDRKQLTLRND